MWQSGPLSAPRPATVTTLLGSITYDRDSYLCPSCQQGHASLDQQLPVAAGSFSTGVQELLALLGATQDSFAQVSQVIARLCLVLVYPNSVRAATKDLGQTLLAHDQQEIATAQETQPPPVPATAVPERRSVSMDGVLAHTRPIDWKEIKTGAVFTTRTRRSRDCPDHPATQAVAQSYVAALRDAETFGWHL